MLSAYLHNLFWLFSSRYFSWTNLIRWSYQNCGWADSQVPDHYWRECPWGQNKIGRIHCVQGEPLSSGCEAVTNLSVSKVTGGKSRRLPWHQELTPYASSLRMKARSATPQAGDIILYYVLDQAVSQAGVWPTIYLHTGPSLLMMVTYTLWSVEKNLLSGWLFRGCV